MCLCPSGVHFRCIVILAALVLILSAVTAMGAVYPPTLRALELPAGVTELAAEDPLLDDILNGATSSGPGPIVHDQVGNTLPIGKTWVTWTDLSTGQFASAYVYLYPDGWQVLGRSTSIRAFEHNGA